MKLKFYCIFFSYKSIKYATFFFINSYEKKITTLCNEAKEYLNSVRGKKKKKKK